MALLHLAGASSVGSLEQPAEVVPTAALTPVTPVASDPHLLKRITLPHPPLLQRLPKQMEPLAAEAQDSSSRLRHSTFSARRAHSGIIRTGPRHLFPAIRSPLGRIQVTKAAQTAQYRLKRPLPALATMLHVHTRGRLPRPPCILRALLRRRPAKCPRIRPLVHRPRAQTINHRRLVYPFTDA